jgi:hypothetical protein
MKPFKIYLVVLISVLLFCSDWLAAEPIETAYLYKGFDTNGVLAIEGVLNLGINTNQVKGTWELKQVAKSEDKKLGPQIGSGKLTGEIKQGKIDLNLNPEWADNNVMLSGVATSTNISGTWGYYGFAGRMTGGKFEAVKKAQVTQ